jgi:hypothetical protein
VEQPLAKAAAQVYAGEIKTAESLRTALDSITPTDAEFAKAFASTRSSKPKLARYYLRALEQAWQEADEPYFVLNEDPAEITLEHVLPRKPEGNWPTFDSETHDAYVNRLGNQALMRKSDNNGAGSDPFEDKRESYEGSPYETTKQIAGYDQWDPEAVDHRQRGLADLAVKAWPV